MSTATLEKTEIATVRHLKTRKGEWVISGPSSLVTEGPITVTRKNGTTSVVIVHGVGKDFLVDGVQHRYGYHGVNVAASVPAPAAAVPPAPAGSDFDFLPDDFMPGDDADTADWE